MFDFVTRFFIIANIRTRESVANGRNEDGASAVEYGLLIAGIAALVAAVVFILGDAISALFTDMTGEINNAP